MRKAAIWGLGLMAAAGAVYLVYRWKRGGASATIATAAGAAPGASPAAQASALAASKARVQAAVDAGADSMTVAGRLTLAKAAFGAK